MSNDAAVQSTSGSGKRCFVTIGATAPFNALLAAVLSPDFLRALRESHYEELRLQYGKEGEQVVESKVQQLGSKEKVKEEYGIEISGFGFNQAGLGEEMRIVAANMPTGGLGSRDKAGIVISHAGSGSILDALRVQVPLIVVPNKALLHNHQLELAEELAELDYVVHGNLDKLADAVIEAELLRKKMRRWPPIQSGEENYGQALATVMDEEMGWVD